MRVPLLTKVFNHTMNGSLLEFLNLYWHLKRNEENKLLTFLIKARSGGNRLIALTFEKRGNIRIYEFHHGPPRLRQK